MQRLRLALSCALLAALTGVAVQAILLLHAATRAARALPAAASFEIEATRAALVAEVNATRADLVNQVGAGRVYLGHQRSARGLDLERSGRWQRTGGPCGGV